MSLRKSFNTIGLITGLVSLTALLHAADPIDLSGQILGEVRSAAGVAQMGATVYLYDHSNQLIRQVLSNQDGKFIFDAVTPDIYSIKVTLASFLPALRKNIAVAAGSESDLRINLSSVLSSVQLAPGAATPGTLMTDEWKWVLRSSHSTRPVLRLQPGTSSSRTASVFSDTTGIVQFSAGDGNLSSGSLQQDMGTAFAVATSVKGSTRVRMSGNFGYAASGVPSAGLRTTYSHDSDSAGTPGPRMSLTVRQIYLPSMTGSGLPTPGAAGGSNSPVLRTASLATIDSLKLTDPLNVEYGFGLDSVSLYGRMNYFSPFVRANYDLGKRGAVQVAYSSGGTPAELINGGVGAGGAGSARELSQDLAVLGQLPDISRRDNQAAVQRTRTYEAGYQIKRGSRTYSASVYRDEVSNAAFLISGDANVAAASDLLPDLNSRGIMYNVGDFRRGGYGVSVDQSLGDHAELSVAGGRGDALVASQDVVDRGDLRGSIHNEVRPWVTAQIGGSLPQSGTYLATSYGWSDYQALTPTHAYLTGKTSEQIGWDIHARQRLPALGNMHMELTAELRNMLAQGYLTIRTTGGRAVLTNSPRAVRGGLNFIF